MQDLEKLFLDGLADMYHAEKQLLKALPKMVKAAGTPELKEAFEEHLSETREQVGRLEDTFQLMGRSPKTKKCNGMAGIIKEGEEEAKEYKGNSALDAALIAAAQRVEHYEIAGYGCLCTWAKELGHREALALLKENLSEEKGADHKLSELAETHLNLAAARFNTPKGRLGRAKKLARAR